MSLLLVLFGLTGQWLIGIGFASFLLRDAVTGKPATWWNCGVERAGLGLVLGIALTSGLSFLYSLLGGSLGREWSLILAASGWLWGGSSLGLLWFRWSPQPPPAAVADPAGLTFVRICQWSIFILFVLALVQTLLTPQRFWDERATFAIKAALLNEDGTVYSGDLADPDFVQYHPRYPLLIPLAEQHIYALLGNVNDRWSKVLFPLMYLGLMLTFAGVLQRNIPPARAWLFALLLATAPVLMPWEYGFLCAQADAPVACFHGVSVLYLWNAMRNRNGGVPVYSSLTVAGVSAAAAAFTKDEGLALLMVDGLALMIALGVSRLSTGHGRDRRDIRQRILAAAVFVGVAMIAIAPWLWHRGSLPTTTEMNYFGRATPEQIREQIGTLAWSIPHVAHRMLFEVREWGLHWWLMILGLAAFPLRALRAEQLMLMLDVLGAVAALLLAGMLSPTEVTEHLGGSSHRFLMQLVPVAVLYAAGQWSETSR